MTPGKVASTDWNHSLEIERKDFLDAIRVLKPRRVNIADKLSEFQLGYVDGEAVFCIHGAQTRRPARGVWPGFACFRFAFMLAVLKEPPPGPLIEIGCSGTSVKIGTTRLQARWIDTPAWIAEMALYAHLHGPDEEPVSPPLYCPKCGKREGVLFGEGLGQAGRYPVRREQLSVGGRLFGATPTRECRTCGHQWIELDDS